MRSVWNGVPPSSEEIENKIGIILAAQLKKGWITSLPTGTTVTVKGGQFNFKLAGIKFPQTLKHGFGQ